MAPADERSLPVHCPACGHAVTIIIDTGIPLAEPQYWKCPNRLCETIHSATFDAKIAWVGRRAAFQAVSDTPPGGLKRSHER